MPAHRDYLFDLGYEIKSLALEARRERDTAAAGEEAAFRRGRLLAFYEVVSVMRNRARGLGLPLEDLLLQGIEPDRDLT